MSAAKRSRGRNEDSKPTVDGPSAKRLKTVNGTHVPPPQRGLGFLVDENARANKKLEAKLTNGVAHTKSLRPDESKVVIAGVADSEEEEDEDSEMEDSEAVSDSSDGEDGVPLRSTDAKPEQASLPNGRSSTKPQQEVIAAAVTPNDDEEMTEAEANEGSPEREELSFGELLRSKHPDPIDVAASYPSLADDQHALVSTSNHQALTLSAGTSLGTVLQQALKTDDRELLESCLRSNDTDTIRRTIQRLPSQHICTLLQRLAERIHKRPGRAGSLMVWVQWSLVAHGGYLAGQPALMRKLRALSTVLRERARGLQPLLHLKGKLDLLSAQMELRRQLQEESRAADAADDEDEEGVLYVEGQAEQWSDVGSDAGDVKRIEGSSRSANSLRKTQSSKRRGELIDDESGDDKMLNGDLHMDEVDDMSADEEEDEDEEGNMLDIEAEEASEDEEEDELDSVEESDDEPDDESESSADGESDASGIKEPKLAKLNRKR